MVDLCLQLPGRLRYIAEQLSERRPDAVLAVPDACGCDEDGVVSVIGDDLIQGSPRPGPERDAGRLPRACGSSCSSFTARSLQPRYGRRWDGE
jgi:hypothetical protein